MLRPLRRALLLVPLLLACGGSDTPPAAGAPGDTRDAASGASAPPGGDGCPETGAWQRCSIEKRLERAGLVAKPLPDTARVALFSVPGLRYDVGRGELQVYLYPDSAARKRDTGALDPTRAARPGEAAPWNTQATLITSGNMAAVYLGVNATQAERVQLALGAGLPAR
jgi:hypothetical protein